MKTDVLHIGLEAVIIIRRIRRNSETRLPYIRIFDSDKLYCIIIIYIIVLKYINVSFVIKYYHCK